MLSTLLRTGSYNTLRARPSLISSIRQHAITLKATSRRYASQAPLGKRPPPSGTATLRPTTETLERMSKLRKIEVAEQMYNSGNKILYSSSKRLTIFRLQCYALACLCASIVYYYTATKMLDPEAHKERGLPVVIRVCLYITALFLAATASFCVRYSGGHVHRIELVKQLDQIFLQLTVRGRLPFYTYKRLLTPFDLRAHPKVVAWQSVPEWMLSKPLNESSPSATIASALQNLPRQIARAWFTMFSAAKQFFGQAGIVRLDFQSGEGKKKKVESLRVDLDGRYAMLEGAQTKPVLWEFVTITEEPLEED